MAGLNADSHARLKRSAARAVEARSGPHAHNPKAAMANTSPKVQAGPTTIDLLALAYDVERGVIPALSIRQPYPHHIFHDAKDVENRDWPTSRRGWFIVHAGISKVELDPTQHHLPRGGVVGMARIDDCVTAMESRWFFGDYGFVIGASFPLPLIPCRGALSFFRLPQDVLKHVAAAIRVRHAADAMIACRAGGVPAHDQV